MTKHAKFAILLAQLLAMAMAGSVLAQTTLSATGTGGNAAASAIRDPDGANPIDAQTQFIEFRARKGYMHGHAVVLYGARTSLRPRAASLYPLGASELIGHLFPVPAGTAAVPDDYDERLVTARYRIPLSQAQATDVAAFIERLKRRSGAWHITTNNCLAFAAEIAERIGLRIPGSVLIPPDQWVSQLARINGRDPALAVAGR